MILLTAPLEVWTNGEGSVHFITLPAEQAGEAKAHSMLERRGFGSVRVEATIDDVTWRTSIFPTKNGGYFLPVKIAVCRKVGIAAGDDVSVELELL